MFGDAGTAFDGAPGQPLPDSKHVHATPRHATPRHATPRHATPRQDKTSQDKTCVVCCASVGSRHVEYLSNNVYACVSAAASGFEDAFDDFPSSTKASESGVSSSYAAPSLEEQFGDFADIGEAQPSSAVTAAEGTVAKERRVADLIAQLPDLTYMLEHSVAPRAPA
jgi:hypothetical protein